MSHDKSPIIPEAVRTAIEHSLEQDAELLTRSVQQLIQIRSVSEEPREGFPYGRGPAAALDRALAIARELGFSATNLDNRIGYAEYGSGDDYVAVLGHVDTVPEGEDWTHAPLGGEIADGKIFGRGALDDKGPLLAALFGLYALRKNEISLGRKVRVIFGSDEETGFSDVSHYLSRMKPPISGFTPDGDFPVVRAEKGVFWIRLWKHLQPATTGTRILSMSGGAVPNVVPNTAQVVLSAAEAHDLFLELQEYVARTGASLFAEEQGDTVVIRSKGVSAHGSTPEEGKNAVMQLVLFFEELDNDPSEMTEAIAFFGHHIGSETRGESFGLRISDLESGDLTLNVGIIEAREDQFSITLDIRHPITSTKEEILNRIATTLDGSGFFYEILRYDQPLYYPLDAPLITVLQDVYREVTGDGSLPVAIGGETYARKFPNIVAFGPYLPGTLLSVHAPDEYISLDELISLARIYACAIYALANEN